MKTYWFERWCAEWLMIEHGLRSAAVVIDGEPACGVVRGEGVGVGIIRIDRPYLRPTSVTVLR